MKKAVLVILDGLGDRPLAEFGGKTPLEAARKPNLDRLAREGITGIMDSVEGIYPGSDVAHLSIFGYPLEKYYTGRGIFEAAGMGMKARKGDIAFRANLGTVDRRMVVWDRRAGRIESTEGLVRLLNGTRMRGVKFLLKAGDGHRAALIMRGRGLSHRVSNGDPHKTGLAAPKIMALDGSEEAEFTADVLNEFIAFAHEKLGRAAINKKRIAQGKLPANYLLVRGASIAQELPGFGKRYGLRACCIAGGSLYRGIGKAVGMDAIRVRGATCGTDADVKAKFLAARKALKKYDFIFVHVKGTDIMGEDGNAEGKKRVIEKIDRAAGTLLGMKGVLLVVSADHSTPCSLKDHSSDPVPVLVNAEWLEADGTREFGERACAKGSLGRIKGLELMPKIMELLRRQ